MQQREMITVAPGMTMPKDDTVPKENSLVKEGLKMLWDAIPADMGKGHAGKMARLGFAELQSLVYPEATAGLPPVVSAGALEHNDVPENLREFIPEPRDREPEGLER